PFAGDADARAAQLHGYAIGDRPATAHHRPGHGAANDRVRRQVVGQPAAGSGYAAAAATVTARGTDITASADTAGRSGYATGHCARTDGVGQVFRTATAGRLGGDHRGRL